MSPVRLLVCRSWLLYSSSITLVKRSISLPHHAAALLRKYTSSIASCCFGRAAGAYAAGCVCLHSVQLQALWICISAAAHPAWWLVSRDVCSLTGYKQPAASKQARHDKPDPLPSAFGWLDAQRCAALTDGLCCVSKSPAVVSVGSVAWWVCGCGVVWRRLMVG